MRDLGVQAFVWHPWSEIIAGITGSGPLGGLGMLHIKQGLTEHGGRTCSLGLQPLRTHSLRLTNVRRSPQTKLVDCSLTDSAQSTAVVHCDRLVVPPM